MTFRLSVDQWAGITGIKKVGCVHICGLIQVNKINIFRINLSVNHAMGGGEWGLLTLWECVNRSSW